MHVTCTRYLVSGHNDSSTLDDCVNRLPISPPPDTSHVTKQSLGEFCDSQAIFADTNEFSRTIDVTPSDHVANIDLLILVDTVQSSQHCKVKIKLLLSGMVEWNRDKVSCIQLKLLIFTVHDMIDSCIEFTSFKQIYEN